MGVDFTKHIITGVLYNSDELDLDAIDTYLTDNPQWYEKGIFLFSLNPYDTLEGMPDYIIGKLESELDGSGDRATDEDLASLTEIKLENASIDDIKELVGLLKLTEKPIKTYRIYYFT